MEFGAGGREPLATVHDLAVLPARDPLHGVRATAQLKALLALAESGAHARPSEIDTTAKA